MVFPSIPTYLDPTHQWHQLQQAAHHQSGSIIGASSFQLLSHPSPPPQTSHGGEGGGSAVSVRPGSMADRARMANMPLPETALKCPRCESTNTKFCYFNNYSLSQPRHFCKTCRRYWTRGGALRSVPVGGGYRRNNKRTKSSSSKSPVNSQCQAPEVSTGETMRLSYSAISTPNEAAADSTHHPIGFANFLGFDQIQWRPQIQLQHAQPSPLLATSSSYNMGQIQKKMEAAKMEENGQQVNVGKPFWGVAASDRHYWSGFNPPSSSHSQV